jgi:hypothetical protein
VKERLSYFGVEMMARLEQLAAKERAVKPAVAKLLSA